MISIKNLDIWYEKDKYVIKDLNLELKEGTIYGLLGVNGAGKSSLINTICNIHNSYSGEIYILNNNIKRNDKDTKKLRYYVPDYPLLFEEMTPISFIRLVHKLYGKKFDKDKLSDYIKMFNFEKYINMSIKSLSLGNRQKVQIISALILDTPLLILDEPLVGLDVLSIEVFYRELKQYCRNGNTVLLATHIVDIIDNVCEKVIILNDGNIKNIIDVNENEDIRDIFFGEIGYEL